MPEAEENRIVTIPNVVTLLRLACLPWYWYLLVSQDQRAQAALLLAVLGATDWIDGYVARRFHQVSNLGKILDPIADRLLFFVGIVGIIVVGGAPVWFCWSVLGRELVVAIAAVVLALLGAKRIDVTWFGKAGTFCLMFAFPLFLAGSSSLSSAPIFEAFAWMCGIPGLVLSYYAAVMYVPIGLRSLREGRMARVTDPTPDSFAP